MKGFYLFITLLCFQSLKAQPFNISIQPNPPRQNQSAMVTIENLGNGNFPSLQLVYNLGNGNPDVQIPLIGGSCNNIKKVCQGQFTVPSVFFVGIAAVSAGSYLAYSPTTPLSVSLVDATVQIHENVARFHWQTASESQNIGFIIEEKTNEEWKVLAFINGSGNSTALQSYSYDLPYLHPGLHILRLSEKTTEGKVRVLKELTTFIELPQAYALSKAYPNPLTAESIVALSVAQTQEVEVSVYNVLGQKMGTLFHQELQANQVKEIALNAIKLPKGIYFLRAMGTFFEATEKFQVAP